MSKSDYLAYPFKKHGLNMEYGKIVSVTGLPGLFELVSSKNDGAIVRSLEDKSTKFVSSRIHNFSHLESIEIYTVRDNVNLVEVFTAMDSSSDKLPDGKDASVLKKYFEKVFPDLDFERVYSSDMKKIVKWFTILKAADVEIKLREFEEEQAEEEAPAEEVTEKPAKKAAKKEEATAEAEEKPKAAAKKKAAEEESEEEKPKKKAAPKAKKEDEEGEEKPKAAPKKKAAPAAEKGEKAEKKTKK
jgi:chemotaxis protein histidine kinase CheA